jgi:energy-coupling factor transport system substrate-specific component
MGLASSHEDLFIDSWKKGFNFVLVGILSSIACGEIIAWGLEAVNLLPFAVIGPIITLNNTLACVVLGVPLVRLLYGRLNRWDLVWFAIMDEKDISRGRSPKVGTALIWLGVVGGFTIGVVLSASIGGADLVTFGSGATTPSVALAVTPFIIILIFGCLLV